MSAWATCPDCGRVEIRAEARFCAVCRGRLEDPVAAGRGRVAAIKPTRPMSNAPPGDWWHWPVVIGGGAAVFCIGMWIIGLFIP